MVTTMIRNVSPTAAPTLPLAPCTSLGMNGAPAAVASRIKPICKGSSRGISRMMTTPSSGTRTKFASSARTTSRTFFKGWIIADAGKANPIASMLPTTKIRPDRVAIVLTKASTVIHHLWLRNASEGG